MKLKIEEITTANVNTKYGTKKMYKFLCDGISYSCFEDQRIKGWKVGDTVDVEVEQNGKYHNIKLPKLDRGFNPASGQVLEAVKAQLERIEKKLDRLLGSTTTIQNDDVPPPCDEDAPF